MTGLRKNSISNLLLLVAVSACATSYYRVSARDDSKYELSVSPDRVIVQCEHMYDIEPPRETPA